MYSGNPDIHVIELERMKFAAQTMLSRRMVEDGFHNPILFDFIVERLTDNLIAAMQINLAGKKLDTFTYSHPATWREGWKEAFYKWLSWPGGGHMPWLGDYLKKRYPVRMHIVEYDTRVLYPKIPVKDQDYRIHIARLDNIKPLDWREDRDV